MFRHLIKNKVGNLNKINEYQKFHEINKKEAT